MTLINSKNTSDELAKRALEKMSDSDLVALCYSVNKYAQALTDVMDNDETRQEFFDAVRIIGLAAMEATRRGIGD